MKAQRKILALLIIFTGLTEANQAFAACKSNSFRTADEIIEAQNCLKEEIRQASSASEDLQKTVAAMEKLWGIVVFYSGQSTKEKVRLQLFPNDLIAQAKYKEAEASYREAFITYEQKRKYMTEITNQHKELEEIIIQIQEKIEHLRKLEAILKIRSS